MIRSIYAKLITPHLFASFVILAMLAVVVDRALQRRLDDLFFKRGEALAESLATSIEPYLALHDIGVIQRSLIQMAKLPHVECA